MTSPWSSPRTLILFPSRLSSFSSVIPLDYSTPLVHGSRRNGLQQVGVVRLGRPSTASRSVVLTRIGEHRNGPGVFVHFEHREHLKAARIIEAKAQDYQTGVLSSHLRVRVSAGLDENGIVVSRSQHAVDQIEQFGCPVDDGDLLHQWSISRGLPGIASGIVPRNAHESAGKLERNADSMDNFVLRQGLFGRGFSVNWAKRRIALQ